MLYIFQNVLLPPPDDFFRNTEKLLTRFIWKTNQARIRLSVLHLECKKGGWKCLILTWYYWAVQSRSIAFFSQQGLFHNGKKWNQSVWVYFLFIHWNLLKKTTNPIVKNVIKVRLEVWQFIKEPNLLSLYSPHLGIQRFTPWRADAAFRQWALKGQLKKIRICIYLTQTAWCHLKKTDENI